MAGVAPRRGWHGWRIGYFGVAKAADNADGVAKRRGGLKSAAG